jgi:hypothetical protein
MFLRRKKSKTDLLKEQVSDLTGKAVETAGRAAVTLAPVVESARESAKEAAGRAAVTLAPVVESARESAKEAAGAAYEAATPHVTKAKAAAAPAVAAALVKAASVLPSAEEEPPKKKGGRLKKLLVLLGLGGVAFAVSKKLQGSSTPPAPSRPTPVPDPAPTPAPEPVVTPTAQPAVDIETTVVDVEKPVGVEIVTPLTDNGDAAIAGDDDGSPTVR